MDLLFGGITPSRSQVPPAPSSDFVDMSEPSVEQSAVFSAESMREISEENIGKHKLDMDKWMAPTIKAIQKAADKGECHYHTRDSYSHREIAERQYKYMAKYLRGLGFHVDYTVYRSVTVVDFTVSW